MFAWWMPIEEGNLRCTRTVQNFLPYFLTFVLYNLKIHHNWSIFLMLEVGPITRGYGCLKNIIWLVALVTFCIISIVFLISH